MTDLLFEQALRLRSGVAPTRTVYRNFGGVLVPVTAAVWVCSCGQPARVSCDDGDKIVNLCDVCWEARR